MNATVQTEGRYAAVVTAPGLKGEYTVRYHDHLLLGQGTLVFHKMFWWFYHK
jgi:hypothetical protein